MMLPVFEAACLIYIAAHALVVINKMGKDTCAAMRGTFILIAIGAVAGLCDLIDGRAPTFSDAILISGLVLYFVTNKRRETCQGVK